MTFSLKACLKEGELPFAARRSALAAATVCCLVLAANAQDVRARAAAAGDAGLRN